MREPVPQPLENAYEFASDVVAELLTEIDRVQRLHRLDRLTAVRIVAVLFGLDEGKLLRLTGEARP
jgi:hypothetical protein